MEQVSGEAHHLFGGRRIGTDGVVYRKSRVSPGEHSLDLAWREPLSPFQESEDPGLEIRLGCRGPGKAEWGDLSMPIGNSCCYETMNVWLPI